MSIDPGTAPTRPAYIRDSDGNYYRIGGGGKAEVYVGGTEPTATGPIIWVDGVSAQPPMQVENFMSLSGGNITGNLGVSGQLVVSGSSTFTGGLSAGSLPVTAVGAPVATTDAATKAYVDAAAYAVPTGFRNELRNGDMSVAQRGNGMFAATGTGSYGPDGWIGYASGAAISTSRDPLGTTAPPFSYCFYSDMTTAASAAAHYAFAAHRIEDVRTLAGQTVTLSFRGATSSAGRVVGIAVRQYFGTGGAPSVTVDTAVGSVALNYDLTPYSLTFTVPSISGKAIGSTANSYLELRFWMGVGSTNQSISGLSVAQGTQAPWALSLAAVQLEQGPRATPFERIPVQQQLAWCQRYFYRHGQYNGPHTSYTGTWFRMGTGLVRSATQGDSLIHYPVPMRAVPAVTFTAANTFAYYDGASGIACTSIATGDSMSNLNANIFGNVASGLTLGRGGMLLANAAATAYIDFSAEL